MQTIDRIMAQALPIQEALLWGEDQAQPYPLLWIDASKRPDVADLARVHQMEGEGDLSSLWMYYNEHVADSIFILEVTLERPVQVTFTLVFPLQTWSALIEAIAASRRVVILTGLSAGSPVPAEGPRGVLGMLMGEISEGVTLSFDDRSSADLLAHVQAWHSRYPLREDWVPPGGKAPRWWWPFGRGQRAAGESTEQRPVGSGGDRTSGGP